MSADPTDNGQAAVPAQSPRRYRAVSPGRQEFMRRLNAAGKRGPGNVIHGLRALEEKLRRGFDPKTPLAALHAELKARYVADLGGEECCSAMELGVCDRLADLDLVRGLLNAQRDTSKRMSMAQLEAFATTISRHCAAYLQAVKTVGPRRREKESGGAIVVRRFAESAGEAQGEHNG